MTTEVWAVGPREVADAWPLAYPWIATVCRRASCTWEPRTVLASVMKGEAVLWLGMGDKGCEAVLMTRIVEVKSEKVFHIDLFIAREMKRVVQHFDAIKQWAKGQGCSRIRLQGRKGWERRLGWKVQSLVMVSEL